METKYLHYLIGLPVHSVSIDQTFNVFYIREDNSIYKMANDVLQTRSPLNNPNEKTINDIAMDTLGNLYIASDGCIDVMKMCSTYSRAFLRMKNCIIRYITLDIHNNVYVLANCGSGMKPYRVKNNQLEVLPILDQLQEPFAVDSKRRIYYQNYRIDVSIKYPIGRLYQEKVNSVCVDKHDNVYFGTDNGLFMLTTDTLEAVKIKQVNVPKIVKVGVKSDGKIYFASMDKERGGVYTLSDCPEPFM